MFEARLKIVLWIIAGAMFALAARAGTIQLVQRDRWARQAQDLLTQHQLIETSRGRILDCRGREMAVDAPCMDACVEYPAIAQNWQPDDKWLHDQAVTSALRRYGQLFTQAGRPDKRRMLDEESSRVIERVSAMWGTLADVSGQTTDQIDARRNAIIQRVQLRQQFVQWQNYRKAIGKRKSAAAPWYARWWPAGRSEDDDVNLDDYAVDVAEQTQPQVVLPAIDTDVYNQLAKDAEDMPGLVLRPGRRRVYPLASVACHILGRIGPVTAPELAADLDRDDPLRKYWPNDLAGQDGVERLCERQLRGTRGELTSVAGSEQPETTTDPVAGSDVTLSIDSALQAEIELAFAKRRVFVHDIDDTKEVRENQPGAAVVIDVATGKVRALVSYPLFDPNEWDTDYARLSVDDINQPLLNRACDAAYEPGSTVKPLMGLAALADGLITPQSTIECTGYLILGGHRFTTNRCWTISEYPELIARGIDTSHHKIPDYAPHPTGFLTVTDAIERSCDVFFETVADKMHMARQRSWYARFGLGHPTGIGLSEVGGRLPNPTGMPIGVMRLQTWNAAIGQGMVAATPLQMANVAAMMARDGVWMQPRLLENAPDAQRIDLQIPPTDMAAVKLGMERVVNSLAGTGHLHRLDAKPDEVDALDVAGKTGTAQASRLTVPVRDDQGRIVMKDGRELRKLVDPADPAVATWYIGGGKDKTQYDHAWFIGYAPADHPKIAFAVFVEYGGSGGPVAGAIAHDLLASCIEQGYFH